MDGISLKLLQAMASGVPIIVSDTARALAWIEPAVTGKLFRVGAIPEPRGAVVTFDTKNLHQICTSVVDLVR